MGPSPLRKENLNSYDSRSWFVVKWCSKFIFPNSKTIHKWTISVPQSSHQKTNQFWIFRQTKENELKLSYFSLNQVVMKWESTFVATTTISGTSACITKTQSQFIGFDPIYAHINARSRVLRVARKIELYFALLILSQNPTF